MVLSMVLSMVSCVCMVLSMVLSVCMVLSMVSCVCMVSSMVLSVCSLSMVLCVSSLCQCANSEACNPCIVCGKATIIVTGYI